VAGTVDPEQHGGARESVAVKQFADRDERRRALYALVAPEIDGQLRGLVQLLRELERRYLPRQQACTFECQQSTALDGEHVLEQPIDSGARVDRDRYDWQVLRQGERSVGVHLVLATESLDSTHQNAGLDLVTAV